MIIPTSCFTCGKPISHLWNSYLEQITKLNNDNNIEEKKDNEPQENTNENTNEKIVLDNLKLKRYCCRRMFLTNVDVCDKI
jgi:DNA-directed RNA polymerase subunit N (RpoN/RPB10)